MSIVAATVIIGDDAASAVEQRVLGWCRSHEGASIAKKREAAKLIIGGYVQGYDDVASEFARNDAFRSLNETIVANVGRDRDKGAMFARAPTGLETCMFGPGRAAAVGIGRGSGQGLQGPLRGGREGVPQMGEAASKDNLEQLNALKQSRGKPDPTIEERIAALEKENGDLKAASARAALVDSVAKATE